MVRQSKHSIVTFGPYRLVGKLGEGGLGTVHLAQDEDGRRFALKTLKATTASTVWQRDRFMREMRMVLRLKHPHIVEAYDIGAGPNATLFILMEYCMAGSLQRRLRKHGPLPVNHVLRWMIQLADALDYASREHQVVHRDIKPANLMLDPQGRCKLCDFGLAHRTSPDATRMTADGTVLGSALYMSPEQARGKDEIDSRADLYSVGATFYHLLAGVPIFGSKELVEILRCQVKEEPIPLSKVREDLPARLVELIHHLLQKDREKRVPSAAALRKELQGMFQKTKSQKTPSPEPGVKEPAARKRTANRTEAPQRPEPEVKKPAALKRTTNRTETPPRPAARAKAPAIASKSRGPTFDVNPPSRE